MSKNRTRAGPAPHQSSTALVTSDMATVGLFLATVSWGASFFLVKKATLMVGVWPYLTYRFAIVSVLMVTFFPKKMLGARPVLLQRGAILGLLLFLAIWTQTKGLQLTTATRSGFLTALYLPMTPMIGWLFLRQRVHPRQLGVVLFATIGLYFLTKKGPLFSDANTWWKEVNPGDLWTILTAVVSATHIVITEKFSRQEPDSVALGMWQFIWCTLLVFVTAGFQHHLEPTAPWNIASWPAFAVFSVCFNALFCTIFAFIMQIIAQKTMGTLKAALIFALEAPCASGFASVYLGEVMTPREFSGALIVFLTSILPESWLKKTRG